MKRLINSLKFLVIAGILGFIAYMIVDNNGEQRKILIVHSYGTSMTWVNDIDQGIDRALSTERAGEFKNLIVRRHYMNLLGQNDCNIRKNAAAVARFTIDDWKPEVIVLVDDIAQGLVGFNQLKFKEETDLTRLSYSRGINKWLSGNCPEVDLDFFDLRNPADSEKNPVHLVFAGVNRSVQRYGYRKGANVSGIFERKNYNSLLETLIALREAYPGKVEAIQMLNDSGNVAAAENKSYSEFDWSPHFRALPAVAAVTREDWDRTVEEANKNNVMLLTTNYDSVFTDKSKTTKVDPRTLIQETEAAAKLPVLGANTKYVTDGGMMTVAVSGTEQGRVAMELAFAALDGAPDDNWREAQQYLIGMDQGLLRKRELVLPSIYRAFSTEIGQFKPEDLEQIYVEETVD